MVARAQGVAVYRTTIGLKNGRGGATITAAPSTEEADIGLPLRDRARWEKHLRILLAGAIAEQMFSKERILGIFAQPDDTFRDDGHEVALSAFALYSGIDRELTPARFRRVCERLGRLHTETRRLVERHRSHIERVARALREKRRLNGQEVSALLAEAA